MPIANIIDQRTNEFNPHCDAVLEIWSHVTRPGILDGGHIETQWIERSTVNRITRAAMNYRHFNVTIYLYDRDKVRAEMNSMPIIHPRIQPESLFDDGLNVMSDQLKGTV